MTRSDPIQATQPDPVVVTNGRGVGGVQKKRRYTLHLPETLIERLRDAVYWTPGLTLAQLAEGALREAVDALEAERGGAFPKREAELSAGRPIGQRSGSAGLNTQGSSS